MPKKPSNTPLPVPSSNMDEAKKAVLDRALNDIVKRYGEGSIMRLGRSSPDGSGSHSYRLTIAGYRLGDRRYSQGSDHRDIWSRIIGEDDHLSAHRCRSAEKRRHCCVCRHGTCTRPLLRSKMRCGCRESCSSPNQILVSRLWKSLKPWYARGLWYWWLSILLRR